MSIKKRWVIAADGSMACSIGKKNTDVVETVKLHIYIYIYFLQVDIERQTVGRREEERGREREGRLTRAGMYINLAGHSD